VRRMVFVGVTTGDSSINRIFPRWRDALGLGEAELVGCDIALDAPPEDYRAAVESMRDEAAGALVTSHKIDILRHARDLFDELDEHARRLNEVSCIAIRDGRVLGWAKDPVTGTRSLDALLPNGHFAATGGHALIMGAGGAGTALAHCLQARADRPERIVVTDRAPDRLARARELVGGGPRDGSAPAGELARDGGAAIELVEIAEPHDHLLASLPPGTLVINATGMGKDRPGSPLTDAATFPDRAVAWELNYRGELRFLRQARAQAAARRLIVEDGWRYFLEGWSSHIEEVFQRPISAQDVEALSEAADFARPAISRG
jgi:shikimate dehydrogenase